LVVAGPLHELAVDERGAGADECDQARSVDRARAVLAASMSVNAIANPAARERALG
jgi:hypothetical protein